ncbi:MAG: hypothetical protein Q4F72_05465 [Desulfovibrionaceae bacterium]|nr:hypothetical protein [Desulfovibrionaceae bacterium]
MSLSITDALLACGGPMTENGGVWEWRLRPGPDFPGFAGHFPGNPVLPAAVQLVMARLLWQKAAGSDAQPGFARVKCTRPIGPGEELLVRLSPGRKGRLDCAILVLPPAADSGREDAAASEQAAVMTLLAPEA